MKKILILSSAFFVLYGQFFAAQKIVLSGNSSNALIQQQINQQVSLLGTTNFRLGIPGNPGFTYANIFTSGCSDLINLAITGINDPYDLVNAMVVQPDGKIVVAGSTRDRDGNDHCALARFLPDGTLDLSFGQNNSSTTSLIPGTVYITHFIASGTDDVINAVALDKNGNIIVAGTTKNTEAVSFFTVARFLPNGILDASFGKNIPAGNGALCDIPGTVYLNSTIAGGAADVVSSVVIDSSNNIIVGGPSQNTADPVGTYFALAKFLNSGTNAGALDTSFMGDGWVSVTGAPGQGTVLIPGYIAGGGPDNLAALAIDHNGAIVAAGSSVFEGTGSSVVALARFLPSGGIDPSLYQTGGGWGATASLAPGIVCIIGAIISGEGGFGNDNVSAVAIDAQNNIVVGATSTPPAPVALFGLARFLPTGALDTAFFGDTVTTVSSFPGTLFIDGLIGGDIGPIDFLTSLKIDSNGNIVAGGSTYSADSIQTFAVARFTPSGPLDSSFSVGAGALGAGEPTTTNIPGTIFITNEIGYRSGDTLDRITGMGFAADGSLVTAGQSNDSNGTHFTAARFVTTGDTSGSLSGWFGASNQGTISQVPGTSYISAIIPSETYAGITSVAVQTDGKLVAAISVLDQEGITHVGLARFLPNGQLDVSFGALASASSGITSPLSGVVYLTNSVAGGLYDQPTAVAIQRNGSIVLVVQSLDSKGATRCGVVRFLGSGLLDTSFGVNDQTVVSLQPGTEYIANGIAGSDDLMTTVFIDQKGNLVVGGSSFDTAGVSHCSVARFESNGQLDTTFGLTTATTTSSVPGTSYITGTIITGGNDRMNALAVSLSSIFVGGYSVDPTGVQHFSVAQFNSDGVLVGSFGATTATTTSSIPGTVYLPNTLSGGNWDQIKALALESNGSLLVAGFTGSLLTETIKTKIIAFARFTDAGILDSSFGVASAYQVVPFPGAFFFANSIAGGNLDQINALALDPSGNSMAAGSTVNTEHLLSGCMVGLLPNGLLNSAFGQQNTAASITHGFPGTFYFSSGGPETGNAFNALNLQSNGLLTASGMISGGFSNAPSYPTLQSFYTPLTPANYVKTYGATGAGLYC